MTRVLAIGTLACALAGCGTVKNFTEGHNGETKPYGGVKIAAAGFSDDLVVIAMTFPFIVADVVFSAVGDTASLPVTVPAAIIYAVHKGINDYYFPKDKPAPPEPLPMTNEAP